MIAADVIELARARCSQSAPASPTSTASASPTRSSARARRRSCCCRRGRSSTRASGRRRSRTWPATSASSRSTRAATAARTARDAPTAYGRADAGARRRWRCSTPPAPTTASMVVHCGSRGGGLLLAADHPRPGARRVLHVARAAASPRRCPSASASRSTPSSSRTRAGRRPTGTTGRATTATTSSSSSADASPSRTRRSRSRTAVGWAHETDAETLIHTIDAPGHRPDDETIDAARARRPAPCSSSRATRTRLVPHDRAARVRRGSPAPSSSTLEGVGHLPNARHPVQFNLLAPRLRRARLRAAARRRRAGAGR